MLRITVQDHADCLVLKLAGQLVGPWVEELDRTCGSTAGRRRQIQIDLGDVSFVDRTGARLLARLRTGGITLVGVSPFVREQVRQQE